MRRLPAALAFTFACSLPLALRAEIKDRIAAIVNGQPITLSALEERFAPELSRIDQLPRGPARDAQRKLLLHQAIGQLIDEKLVETEATTLGVDVSEDEIEHGIERLAKQQGLKDAQALRDEAERQGISIETVRDAIRRQQLTERLLQYRVKPRRVSDEEVQAAYAQMTSSSGFEAHVRDIFIASPPSALEEKKAAAEAKANEALRRLHAGDSFAKVARDLSEGPAASEGGDLGYIPRGVLESKLDEVAFSLQPGESSGLVRVPERGFHILHVDDRRKVQPRPMAEVQEEIRQRLTGESLIKEREQYLETLRKTAQIDEKL